MGLRLPLDSLPWSDADDLLTIEEPNPFAPRWPLAVAGQRDDSQPPGLRPGIHGVHEPVQQSRVGASGAQASKARSRVCPRAANLPPASSFGVVRRAARRRVVHLHAAGPELEDYLDLVAAVEATSRALGMRVVLEGYPPPSDPRLLHFSVTSDPGVIEVNVQPVSDWDGLVEQTTTLYEDARHAGLSPEKFMLDGRHTGTGGGNHFVLGGQPRQTARSCGVQTCAKPRYLLAQSPVVVVPVLGALSRPDEPGAAHR